MGFAEDTFIFAGVGLGIALMSFFILNWRMKGYIKCYLQVAASRGKLILSEIVTPTDNYWGVGKIENKAFVYKTRTKEKKRITPVPKRAIEHIMGVSKLKVDEHEDFFYLADGKLPSPGEMPDATATDQLIERVMMAAGLQDPRVLWILIICVVVLVAVGIDIFLTNEAITTAKACKSLTATIK